jgi:hypothetical protein
MRSITRPRSRLGLGFAMALLLGSFTACEALPETPAAAPGDESSLAAVPNAPRRPGSTSNHDGIFDDRVVRDVESVRGSGGPSITDLVVDRAANQATYSYRLGSLGRITGRIEVTTSEQLHEVSLEGTPIFLGRYPLDVTLPPIEIDDRGWLALATRLGEVGGRALAEAVAAVLADPRVEQAVTEASDEAR